MHKQETRNKVFIGIPNTGNLRTELVYWLLQQTVEHVWLPIKRPIDANRNYIVNQFLKTDADWLLMVDSDVVPPVNVLEMINNNVPVCSAHVSTLIDGNIVPVGMIKDGDNYLHRWEHSEPGLHEVDATGTGCILIRRDVFDSLDKPYFRFIYNEEGDLIRGEDFDFTDRVGDCYFDSRYVCKHYTTAAV
jgi:hypothetical protein